MNNIKSSLDREGSGGTTQSLSGFLAGSKGSTEWLAQSNYAAKILSRAGYQLGANMVDDPNHLTIRERDNVRNLPPEHFTEEKAPASETSTEALRGNGELILIVDDEESVLRVTKMILENKGYRIITAHDGPAGVATFGREVNAISVVLTDMSLPLMDGLTLIRSLKKIKPSVPFIASTGESQDVYAQELEKLGVTNLLTKPYDTKTLLETLRQALPAIN